MSRNNNRQKATVNNCHLRALKTGVSKLVGFRLIPIIALTSQNLARIGFDGAPPTAKPGCYPPRKVEETAKQ